MRARAFAILTALFLTQPANAEPDHPSGAVSRDSCDSISGLYKNAGEYFPAQLGYAIPRLDWTLFLREFEGKSTGIELTWNKSANELAVRVLGGNLFPPENLSYSIPASCVGGTLTYEIQHQGYSEGGTHSKVRMKARLSKDGAGKLILNGKSYIESTDLLIFRRTHESEVNALFFPL